MTFIRKRESYGRFAVKAVGLLSIMGIAGVCFANRFHFGIDTQVDKCLPGYSFYLIDRKDKSLTRGDTYAFLARGMHPFFAHGTQMVKVLEGLPSDRIEVSAEEIIRVNDQQVGMGLPVATTLNVPVSSLVGKTVLGEGTYWFMGKSERSFDSRYWGVVSHDQIVGRAYALF